MQTEILKKENKDINIIRRAADILKSGGLVAIPTETVYGLAANALNSEAVNKIFAAKGRPQDNPLIVHIAELASIENYAIDIPKSAYDLAEAFWPGPLTIILKKSPIIPLNVSAGLDSVGLRMPDNSITLKLIKEAGIPLAAPSANLSGSPSPTTALHVADDLNGKIDAILDGGECGVGVESTVITLCTQKPKILRPGGITPEQIKAIIGEVEIDNAVTQKPADNFIAASPGMKYRHYAPRARVIIINGSLDKFIEYINKNAEKDCAVLCFDGEQKHFSVPCISYGKINNSESQAKWLFGALRAVDDIGAKTVYARAPQKDGVGLAVYNRLLRAASFEEIYL